MINQSRKFYLFNLTSGILNCKATEQWFCFVFLNKKKRIKREGKKRIEQGRKRKIVQVGCKSKVQGMWLYF